MISEFIIILRAILPLIVFVTVPLTIALIYDKRRKARNNNLYMYNQPPQHGKQASSAKIVLPIIMLVVGGIVCFVNVMMLIVVSVMPNSIGAYYVRDSLEASLFNPVFFLTIGAALVVVWVILLYCNARKVKEGR